MTTARVTARTIVADELRKELAPACAMGAALSRMPWNNSTSAPDITDVLADLVTTNQLNGRHTRPPPRGRQKV